MEDIESPPSLLLYKSFGGCGGRVHRPRVAEALAEAQARCWDYDIVKH